MGKIGIFFGAESGTTRLIAKKIHKLLGDGVADKPVNVTRTTAEEFLSYDALILGIPGYGDGAMPGRSCGCIEPNWEEFLKERGAQERYADTFASSMIQLYRVMQGFGAEMVCPWSTEGDTFNHSAAIVDGQFVGLVIDQRNQGQMTEPRLQEWTAQVKAALVG